MSAHMQYGSFWYIFSMLWKAFRAFLASIRGKTSCFNLSKRGKPDHLYETDITGTFLYEGYARKKIKGAPSEEKNH